MRIDSHQHFWRYNPRDYAWINDQMSILRRDYLPADLEPLLQQSNFDGSIAVQARQNLEETDWLLELADVSPFIKGVVGWVDLRSADLPNQLQRYAHRSKLKGVRHVVQDEPDDNFMLRDDFQRGIALLKQFNLTYDILVFPRQLPAAVKLVEKFPAHSFVLDHIAKPLVRDGVLSPWREHIRDLAGCPNVYCKLSGMVTEARWQQWRQEDFRPYLDVIFDTFGADRLMIGSDWPVCTVAGAYPAIMGIVANYIRQSAQTAQAGILGQTCARFYHL